MKELEKKLKALQRLGYETVDISQVLEWLSQVKRDNQLKAFEKKGGLVYNFDSILKKTPR